MNTIKGSYRTPDGKAQIEYELQHADTDQPNFSASGTYEGGCGQVIEEIAKAYPDNADVQLLAAIWRRWHLNSMRAGCEHQRAAGWGNKQVTVVKVKLHTYHLHGEGGERIRKELEHIEKEMNAGRRVHSPASIALTGWGYALLDAYAAARKGEVYQPKENQKAAFKQVIEITTEKKYTNWVYQKEHPEGVLMKPCPECGYKHGSAWLYEAIPPEVIENIKYQASKKQPTGSLGDHKAARFLKRNEIALRITLSDTKPARWTPAGHHYRVTLSGKNPGMSSTKDAGRRLVFDYWGSAKDADDGRDPSAYDILYCIAQDIQIPETLPDWCANFGGSEDSIKTRQEFKRASAHADRLKVFFLPDEIDDLRGIQ